MPASCSDEISADERFAETAKVRERSDRISPTIVAIVRRYDNELRAVWPIRIADQRMD